MMSLFASMILALSTVINTANLVGNWTRTLPDSDGKSATTTLTFFDDGRLIEEVLVAIQVSDSVETSVSVKILISIEGTWSLSESEDFFSQTFDKGSIKVKVLECSGMPKALVSLLKGRIHSEFKQKMKDAVRFEVIDLTADRLVIKSGKSGEASEFIRKQLK